MSNFENEYRKYSQDSTPDLWARIEAGVDAYEASKKESDSNFDDYNADGNKNVVKIDELKKKSKRTRIAGIIAAAACVCIVAPAIVYMSNNSSSSAPAATDAAPAEMMDEAPAEMAAASDTAEAAEAEYMEPAEAEEYEMAEDVADADMATETADMAETNTMTESEDNDETFDIAKAAKAEDYEETLPVRVCWESEVTTPSDCMEIVADNAPDSKVHMYFDESITDFALLSIQINGYSEENGTEYESEEVYSKRQVNAGDEMVIQLSFPGDTPNYAISFKDAEGNKHALAIMMSGRDGSVVMSEL